MDLVKDIYDKFKKLNKDPKEYLEFKDRKKTGVISEHDFKSMIFDFCKLSFTQKEVSTLVRRYEHATKRGYIDILPLSEDLLSFQKKESMKKLPEENKHSLIYNPKTPIGRLDALKYSTRCPNNVPGSRNYSMKNTVCGRQGVTSKYETTIVTKYELILEEIMKQTYLNDKLVENHFKEFTKHNDLEFDEFKKAMLEINLDYQDEEMKDLYDALRDTEKRLRLSTVDAAVESTVKRNIEECQKLILDDVYSNLKSDPLLNFNDIFAKYENNASHKVTFAQFVTALESKCLNVETANLLLLAKRYCNQYDDEIYYNDFLKDLEKLTKNIDPTKEWIDNICIDIRKALVTQNQTVYKWFVKYANKDDRLTKENFSDSLKDLRLTQLYDYDTIENFYYYCDVNKSGVVSLNELQQTLNKYCQKDINEFVEDIIEAIAEIYNSKNMTFTELESTIERDDLEYFLNEEVKNAISDLDKDLLTYYYRNKGDSRKSSFNAFLNKLSTKFKKSDLPEKMKITKNISSIEVSKERLAEVLRLLSIELDQANINLEDKIYFYDKNGILTEKEFEEIFKGARLNLTTKDVTTLVDKYYNTIDKMVYAKQLLSDLKDYTHDDRSSQKSSKRKAASIKSVAKFINKNNKEKNVVDEMLMTDKNYDGYLHFDEIKRSFHNAGVKLSGSQVTDILSNIKKDRDGKYDYMQLLVALFGETSQIKRFQERIKQRSSKKSERKFEFEKPEGDNALKPSKESRYDERLGIRRERMNSMSSARSSPKSGRPIEEKKGLRSSIRSRGDPSPRSGRNRSSRRGSRSSKSRGSPDQSFESGRDRDRSRRDGEMSVKLNKEASDKVGAGREISVGDRDRGGRFSSQPRDNRFEPSASRSRGDYDSKSRSRGDYLSNSRSRGDYRSGSRSRGDPYSRSPVDRRNDRERFDSKYDEKLGASRRTGGPLKSNLRQKELDSVSRMIGTRIKNSKKDYEEYFRKASHNDPQKLISDKELIDVLYDMGIDLTVGDRERLLLEIDTQKIRDDRRMFSYEQFLRNAGVITTIAMHKSETEALVKIEMTVDEIRKAEDTIEEIKRELKNKDMTLYQAVDIPPSDIDIAWTIFKNDLEDSLEDYGIRLTSDKDKLANLKLYLCGPNSSFIEVERLNKVFGIDVRRVGDRDRREPPRDTLESPTKAGLGRDYRGGLRRDTRDDEEIKIGGRDGPLGAGRSTPLFDQPETFRGDERLPATRGDERLPGRRDDRVPRRGELDKYPSKRDDRYPPERPSSGKKRSQLAYSDEEEEDYEEARQYGKEKVKLDDEGKMNMAANDLLIDLKTKQIDFEKTFGNRSGFLSDQEFIAVLQKVEYVTTSADQLDLLRAAFRDDKERSKISLNKMKQRFNTLDPSYLNKNAVKSEADAKQRLNNLPEKVREYIIRIDNHLKRKGLDTKQVFKEMDKNLDGTISSSEFSRVLLRIYRIENFTLDQINETYKYLDINKNNALTIGELMFYLEGTKRTVEERRRMMSKDVTDQILFDIEKLFEEFDTEHKGYIVEEDLYKMFKAAGFYVDRNT